MISDRETINEIDHYMRLLFPITRSITGSGNRRTLRILQEVVPLKIEEYRSGTKVFDWVIPPEWQVRDAWIKDENGNKLVNFQESNIHLMGYSEPIHAQLDFEQLDNHLHIHPELPDAIPYRTSYYKRDWGFCVTHAQKKQLQKIKGKLEVFVDTDFIPDGSLTIGELLIPGESKKEILISTYICHPSLANDNLSGVVMTAFLARKLLQQPKRKHSYRIIWVPETIGAISYCAMNESIMRKVRSGFVVTTVGGPGKFGYKQSFDHQNFLNNTVEEVFKKEGLEFIKYPFDIHGSDERQYSSLGFRINTISITKDKYYEYPYYHTSLDNLEYVKAEYIYKSLILHLKIINQLRIDKKKNQSQQMCVQQNAFTYKNNYPNCEIMLSKHNLYPATGGAYLQKNNVLDELDIILYLLFYCDGVRTNEEIAEKIRVDVNDLNLVAMKLVDKNILHRATL